MANEYGPYHDSGLNEDTEWSIRTAVLRLTPGTIHSDSHPNTPSWVPSGFWWSPGLYVHANSAHTNVGVRGLVIDPNSGAIRVLHDDPGTSSQPGVGAVIAHGDESFAKQGLLVGPSGGNRHTNLYFYKIGVGPLLMNSQSNYNSIASASTNIWFVHLRPRFRGIGGPGVRARLDDLDSRVTALENVNMQ